MNLTEKFSMYLDSLNFTNIRCESHTRVKRRQLEREREEKKRRTRLANFPNTNRLLNRFITDSVAQAGLFTLVN